MQVLNCNKLCKQQQSTSKTVGNNNIAEQLNHSGKKSHTMTIPTQRETEKKKQRQKRINAPPCKFHMNGMVSMNSGLKLYSLNTFVFIWVNEWKSNRREKKRIKMNKSSPQITCNNTITTCRKCEHECQLILEWERPSEWNNSW